MHKLIIKNHKYHYVVLKNLLFLLKNRYPVKRLDFAQVTDKDVSFFEKLLSPSRVLTNRSDVEGFNIDFLRTCRGDSQVVLKPRSTEEVSEILKYCNQRKLAVVPQGKTITSISLGKLILFQTIFFYRRRKYRPCGWICARFRRDCDFHHVNGQD